MHPFGGVWVVYVCYVQGFVMHGDFQTLILMVVYLRGVALVLCVYGGLDFVVRFYGCLLLCLNCSLQGL